MHRYIDVSKTGLVEKHIEVGLIFKAVLSVL